MLLNTRQLPTAARRTRDDSLFLVVTEGNPLPLTSRRPKGRKGRSPVSWLRGEGYSSQARLKKGIPHAPTARPLAKGHSRVSRAGCGRLGRSCNGVCFLFLGELRACVLHPFPHDQPTEGTEGRRSMVAGKRNAHNVISHAKRRDTQAQIDCDFRGVFSVAYLSLYAGRP